MKIFIILSLSTLMSLVLPSTAPAIGGDPAPENPAIATVLTQADELPSTRTAVFSASSLSAPEAMQSEVRGKSIPSFPLGDIIYCCTNEDPEHGRHCGKSEDLPGLVQKYGCRGFQVVTDGREPKFIERQSPIYLPTEAIGMRGAKDPTEESPDNSKEKLSTEVIRPLGSGQSEARP